MLDADEIQPPVITIGRTLHMGRGRYVRLDRYQYRDIDSTDHYHCAGRDDRSAHHKGYDPACTWCWLNASHTEDAHTESLARYGADTPRKS